jgi:hypothetical protein
MLLLLISNFIEGFQGKGSKKARDSQGFFVILWIIGGKCVFLRNKSIE